MNIHPTAIIASDAQLGEGVEIGPYTIIGDDVKIGKNTVISTVQETSSRHSMVI